ncbi:hypothetical protein CSB11_01650 [Candidatus Campbellbacteria bacterium]|nr:MAG: hypothetical protein CSB11_01650 [Candidatus Campbellbacteria bacterium]
MEELRIKTGAGSSDSSKTEVTTPAQTQTASIVNSNSKFLPQDIIFWSEMLIITFLILFLTFKYLVPKEK